jgi:hypothetical protein
MIIPGTIFTLSLIGVIAVIVNKIQHMNKGRAFVSVSVETDERVKKISKTTVFVVKNSPKIIAHTVAFLALKYSVIVFEKAKKKIYPRIAHLVDAVKGRDVPKNKGSASFFLTSLKKDQKTAE